MKSETLSWSNGTTCVLSVLVVLVSSRNSHMTPLVGGLRVAMDQSQNGFVRT